MEHEEWLALHQKHMAEICALHEHTEALLDKFTEEHRARGREFDERLENMRILVDHLIRRDMEGGQTQ